MLLPLLSVAYAGIVLASVLSSSPWTNLYTWHPICANLFIVFASLGTASAQAIRGPIALSRSSKEPYVSRHALFNWLALFSLLGSAVTIYLNKERNSRPHFTSYHGVSGGATGIIFMANVFGGGAMNTVPALYKYIRFHRMGGYLIYTGVLATHATAVWRGYAGFRAPEQVYGKYGLLALLAAIFLVTISRAKLSLLPGGRSSARAKAE